MRGQAMAKLCDDLQARGLEFGKLDALEVFAREGNWQTIAYAGKVNSLTAWEIEPSFEPALRQNLPMAKVRIGDSFKFLREPGYQRSFDWVVLDNPQNTFGTNDEHCEHFDSLPLVLPTLKEHAHVIFNINWKPFEMERSPYWEEQRKAYYGLEDVRQISPVFLIQFYATFFEKNGFQVARNHFVPRNNEYLAYLYYELKRVCSRESYG